MPKYKYRKFKNPKISYIFEVTLVLSIICRKCGNEDEKKRIEWDIKNSWFNQKYIITLKIWLKKT